MTPRLKSAVLYALFFLSGGVALGYQIAWAKMFATGLGHELPAVLAVVCAFLGGMALGAAMLDRVVSRSAQPGRWYAWLEIVIAAWGFFAVALIPQVNEAALRAIGLDPSPLQHWALAFALPFLTLLPATAAMGATLPAMERFLSPLIRDGRCLGALYAANTSGAVTGTLASAFLIVPTLGFTRSIWMLAQVNLLCGVVALYLGNLREFKTVQRSAETGGDAIYPDSGSGCQRVGSDPQVSPTRFEERPAESQLRQPSLASPPLPPDEAVEDEGQERERGRGLDGRGILRLRITVFLTGLLGIGFEAAGVRVLSQVLENTVYTFAAVLSVYLLGTALGAAAYQAWGRRDHQGTLLSFLLGAIAFACMTGVLALTWSPKVYAACRVWFGDSSGGVLLAEMTTAATTFALPALSMGATFSLLLQAARRPNGGVGRAAAWNTLGGALASLLFVVCLLPVFGGKWTLVIIALGHLALLPVVGRGQVGQGGIWKASKSGHLLSHLPTFSPAVERHAASRPKWVWLPPAASVALLFALPANLQLVQLPPGGSLAAYREGMMASVAVIEDAEGHRSLRVNNRFQMGGTAAASAEYRHAHLPLLLHPAPRRALFLGLGTGITFGAATVHPGLAADGVELVPEIAALMPLFEPHNFSPTRAPQLTVHVADARRFVRATPASYDVIVADLFHPARDGAGSLYTVEHFQALRERLATGGLVCQWLPLYQFDEPMLRVVIRTFLEVFPEAQAWLLHFNVDTPVLGLVGGPEPHHHDAEWIERRLTAPALKAELKKLALADSVRFFGCLLADASVLARFAGDAPLNTDDRPRVTFGAPHFVYQRAATPYGRLVSLLELKPEEPQALFGDDQNAETFIGRMQRYWRARDEYLRGLVDETEERRDQAVDRFVESARLSEDFTPGYARCLTLAALQARTQPAQARKLLRRLVDAQPAQPIAREMLERLPEE